jgi:type IV pilus assembly protein PilB
MARQGRPSRKEAAGASTVGVVKGQKIGRILIKMAKVTRDQVQEALGLQKQRRMPLGQLLIELGYGTQEDVNIALAKQAGMDTIDLEQVEISESVIRMLPAETALSNQVLPVEYEKASNTLTVAIKSADNFRAIDNLRMLMGYEVRAVIGDSKKIDNLLSRHYSTEEESLSALIGEMDADTHLDGLRDRGESIDLDTLMEAADDNKVKKLLNLVLLQSIKDRASDLHFEPFEDEFKMRYRIDGTLYEMVPPPKHLAMPIISRIKVMANLDIGERRMPQDGRIELTVDKKPVDLRVSVLPTMFGESVVMRVLDRSQVNLDMDKLGFRPDDIEVIRQLIRKPNGIVFVTGPTGSGKTTTLYAALNELNTIDAKILTVEDPVEYDIDGLVQVQVNPDVGLTFGRALRSFLRQDPDTILVGETRDLETAQIAVQASLTGHLVFSTLHTNDAPSSIARLLDLGLEPFLVTATVEGIVAQRLVRMICTKCKEPYQPTEQQLMELNLEPKDIQGGTLFRGRGCENCNQSGYRGRMALSEIMVFDDDLRDLIIKNSATQILRAESRKRGMRTLRENGLAAIFEGQTTIDEVVRETLDEDQ